MTLQHVRVNAPVRICDVGGWSDTWFAAHGRVCSIAVQPGVTVDIRQTTRNTRIYVTDAPPCTLYQLESHHPLLAAAFAEIPLPPQHGWDVVVRADIPPGCATGTSAAVAVALLAALACLNGVVFTPHEIAQRAHLLETARLGWQSGIQDQIGAAFGGINDIVMTQYPHSTVTPCLVAQETIMRLNQQLQLWYLGRPHHSSHVHHDVIQRFETIPEAQQLLHPLRQAAADAVIALQQGDLYAYGMALQHNTQGQRTLHPALICADADALISYAATHGALGWKVNGAGGDGGSVSVLWAESSDIAMHTTQILLHYPHMQHIPIQVRMTGIQYDICE